jgi:CheY-like chemotaxis protein
MLQKLDASAPPEVVILDLSLGQSDAVEVIRQLSTLKYQGNVLLISGHDEATLADIQRVGERHGLAMLPSLRKPFRAGDLKSRLTAAPRVAEAPPAAGRSERIGIDLHEALHAGWLELWYQPIVCGLRRRSAAAGETPRARHRVSGRTRPGRGRSAAPSVVEVRDPSGDGGLAALCRAGHAVEIGGEPAGLRHQRARFHRLHA